MRSLQELYTILSRAAAAAGTYIAPVWPYFLFGLVAYGQARYALPISIKELVGGCALLIVIERLAVPLALAHYRSRERYRRRHERQEYMNKCLAQWMFPRGIAKESRSLALVTPDLYTTWKTKFPEIATVTGATGPLTPCRWPKSPRLQQAAARIAADTLRAMASSRTMTAPRELELATYLVCNHLSPTSHGCHVWRFVPGRNEVPANQLHGYH